MQQTKANAIEAFTECIYMCVCLMTAPLWSLGDSAYILSSWNRACPWTQGTAYLVTFYWQTVMPNVLTFQCWGPNTREGPVPIWKLPINFQIVNWIYTNQKLKIKLAVFELNRHLINHIHVYHALQVCEAAKLLCESFTFSFIYFLWHVSIYGMTRWLNGLL